jgi:hypothetical protein
MNDQLIVKIVNGINNGFSQPLLLARRDAEDVKSECSRLARRSRDLEAQLEDMQRESMNPTSFASRSSSGWSRLFEDHQALQAQVFFCLINVLFFHGG